jgi:LDH2 family malate/lactate/ureidoglycolate dehydrogenase
VNTVPTEFIRVMPDPLRSFVQTLFEKVGMSSEDAAFIAGQLVATDLRGVFSHGTRATPEYVQMIRDGKVNPRPNVRMEHDAPVTAVVDGDGGMGHFASYRAAVLAVEKAKTLGLGAATSRNHFHFGAAGKYSRVAVERDCIGFAVSAHRFARDPNSPVFSAGGGSPMSFAIPTRNEPPLVLDMATSTFPSTTAEFEEIFAKMPAAFFKAFGLGAVCQGLGGFLAGIWQFAEPGPGIWEGANQGAFILAVDPSRFAPMDRFLGEMDEYVASVRRMRPFPGYERADLPGGLEAERERQWAVEGIPVGVRHQEALTRVGAEMGVPTPF